MLMNKRESKSDNWDPCHPGTIFNTAETSNANRGVIVGAVLGAGLTLGVIVATVAVFFVQSDAQSHQSATSISDKMSGMNCVSVNAELVAFVNGAISNSGHKKKIAVHILNCPECRKRYKTLCCSGSDVCPTRPHNATLKPRLVQSPNP